MSASEQIEIDMRSSNGCSVRTRDSRPDALADAETGRRGGQRQRNCVTLSVDRAHRPARPGPARAVCGD